MDSETSKLKLVARVNENKEDFIYAVNDIFTCEEPLEVYIKVKNKNGKSGFVPLANLTGYSSKLDCQNSPSKIHFFIHHPYKAQKNDELNLSVGEIVLTSIIASDGWCYGTVKKRTGWFPSTFGTPLVKDFQAYVNKDDYDFKVTRSVDEFAKLDMAIEEERDCLTTEDITKTLRPWEGYEWYFGTITPEDAMDILDKYGEMGDFLIRLRHDSRSLTIMVKGDTKIHNYFIGIVKGQFVYANKKSKSLRKILDIYSDQPIGISPSNKPIYLVKSVKRPAI